MSAQNGLAPAAEGAAVAATIGEQRLGKRRCVRQALQHCVHKARVAQVLQACALCGSKCGMSVMPSLRVKNSQYSAPDEQRLAIWPGQKLH